MEQTVLRRSRRLMARRSELVRGSLAGEGRWIQVRLVEPEKAAVKKKPGRGLALRLLLAALWLFWFVFLGGFLVSGAGFLAGIYKLRTKDFFYALECHKFLWYMGSVWKRNP